MSQRETLNTDAVGAVNDAELLQNGKTGHTSVQHYGSNNVASLSFITFLERSRDRHNKRIRDSNDINESSLLNVYPGTNLSDNDETNNNSNGSSKRQELPLSNKRKRDIDEYERSSLTILSSIAAIATTHKNVLIPVVNGEIMIPYPLHMNDTIFYNGDNFEQKRTIDTGKRKIKCECSQGGSCYRAGHLEGTECDRYFTISKRERHRRCKGCRSKPMNQRKNRKIGETTDKTERSIFTDEKSEKNEEQDPPDEGRREEDGKDILSRDDILDSCNYHKDF